MKQVFEVDLDIDPVLAFFFKCQTSKMCLWADKLPWKIFIIRPCSQYVWSEYVLGWDFVLESRLFILGICLE